MRIRPGQHGPWSWLGLALVYTVIAIGNTLVIATADAAPSWPRCGWPGDTQAGPIPAPTEAALVAALGTRLGAVVTAVTLTAAPRAGRDGRAGGDPVGRCSLIALACLVAAMLRSVATVAPRCATGQDLAPRRQPARWSQHLCPAFSRF
jgi:putative ABC transport system permease protein